MIRRFQNCTEVNLGICRLYFYNKGDPGGRKVSVEWWRPLPKKRMVSSTAVAEIIEAWRGKPMDRWPTDGPYPAHFKGNPELFEKVELKGPGK